MKLLSFLFLLLAVKTESPFWDNIQQDIVNQNRLNEEAEKTKIQTQQNNRTLEDQFISVGGDETQHMKNFKKISELSNETEALYTQCINEIPENNFTEKKIEECLGVESIYVMDDYDYLIKSIISIFDMKIRDTMIKKCYTPAGIDENFSKACDLLEKDTLDLLWQEMGFAQLINEHNLKYTYEDANLNQELFDELTGTLKKFNVELFELLDEAYNHRDLTIVRLKKVIDDRTTVIMQNAQMDAKNPQPMRFKHEISVTEEVENPLQTDMENLPRSTNIGDFNHTFTNQKSNEEMNFMNNFGEDYKAYKTNFGEQGPIITFPKQKKEI